jgi:hypothetical protein
MWTSFVAAVALAAPAADAGSLSLENVRATHGVQGPVRADNKVLPGDVYYLCFDIGGITLGADGKVAYSITTEVRNSDGRVLFRREPKPVEAPTSFGGGRVPAHARLDVGLDTPPGVYTLTMTVTDRSNGASTTLTRAAEVVRKDFGLVRLTVTNDRDGHLPSASLGVGQAAWLQLGAVGFERPEGKPPSVSFTLRFLDETGKPTQANPQTATGGKDVAPTETLVGAQFLLAPNRPGKFTAEITATDETTKKTATLSVPLTVVEPR